MYCILLTEINESGFIVQSYIECVVLIISNVF